MTSKIASGRISAFLLLSLCLACSSGAGGGVGDSSADRCRGTYVCYYAPTDYEFGAVLHRANGQCYLYEMQLRDDGQAIGADGSHGTWRYTDVGFETCFDGSCSECQGPKESDPGTAGSGSSHCHGSAATCSSLSSGGCEEVKGCYLGYDYTYDGNLKTVCKGTARSCSSFSNQTECEDQGSCYWQ